MSIVISYKKNIAKSTIRNLLYFVDDKYNISGIKKSFTKLESKFIGEFLKSQNLSKEIISFDLSSKKKLF